MCVCFGRSCEAPSIWLSISPSFTDRRLLRQCFYLWDADNLFARCPSRRVGAATGTNHGWSYGGVRSLVYEEQDESKPLWTWVIIYWSHLLRRLSRFIIPISWSLYRWGFKRRHVFPRGGKWIILSSTVSIWPSTFCMISQKSDEWVFLRGDFSIITLTYTSVVSVTVIVALIRETS